MSTYMAGSWGIGAYFTKEALHSHPHAFESAGSKSLILAYVILRQCKMVGTEKSSYEVTSYIHKPTWMLTPTV